MIVAHLADLHLGHRAYTRSRAGMNLRERDVADAFRAAVQEIVRLEPDLVVVAGDVFDRPEPPPGAMVALARGLETLRGARPGTRVLIAAGARDTSRSWGDPGALAAFDTLPDVETATGTARSVHLRDGELHVLLLPHRSVLRRPRPELAPDPDARWNVLVAYGRVAPAPAGAEGVAGPGPVIRGSEWDYVALGHDHRHRTVAPGVVFAGSLERVDPEPWAEAHRPGGFVTADLETGEYAFHEVPGRPVVALAPVRWDPDRPERMNERIREVSREVPGGLDGKIVRLRLENIGPERVGELDPELLASLRERAMHLAIEVRRPEPPSEPEPSLLDRVVRRLDADGGGGDALRDAAARALGLEGREAGSAETGG